MGWHINLLKNTVTISAQCYQELCEIPDLCLEFYEGELEYALPFIEDHMEHMDWLWCDEALEILQNHEVNGTVLFTSADGDNKGDFWGYVFTDGVVEELSKKQVLLLLAEEEE